MEQFQWSVRRDGLKGELARLLVLRALLCGEIRSIPLSGKGGEGRTKEGGSSGRRSDNFRKKDGAETELGGQGMSRTTHE